MAEEYKGIMAYSEDKDTLLELLSKGRELADQLQVGVSAVLLGEKVEADIGQLASYGADKVYVVENPQLKDLLVEAYADALYAVLSQAKPETFLIGATKRGKELAPRVAEKLGVGCVAECVGLEVDVRKRELRMKRIVFGGKVSSTHIVTSKPVMATIPPRMFERKRIEGRTAETIKVEVKVSPPKAEIVEAKPKEMVGIRIEEAPIVICGGRGLKQKEDFRLLEELAEILGGQVGYTRPIAADRGWFPEWVGLSGKKIQPSLYIAVGISGAIQHVAGIRGSKIVVSINKDPEAPIFEDSDYGVVGDLYKVVPALTEALRKIKK